MKRKISNFILASALTVLLLICLSACGGVHTVTYLAAEGGYIEGESVQNIKHGKDGAEVTAIPDTDYIFVGWSDGAAAASRKELKVKSDFSVTAMFAKAQLTLKYSAVEGGEIVGNTEQVVDYGKDAEKVTAVPQTGYKFAGWSDGYTAAERQDVSVKSEIDVHALFEKETFIAEYLTAGGGVIKGEDTQKVAYGDYTAEVTAVPKDNCLFIGWSDGVTEATRSDCITGEFSVVAKFKADGVTLTYIAGENGEIVGERVQNIGRGKNGRIVAAYPKDGYIFDRWTDGYPKSIRQDFNVTKDLTVTALFKEAIFTITYTHDKYGRIEGETTQIVRLGEDAAQVTAIPDEHYYFNMWSDHSKDNPRRDTNIKSDFSVNAIFLPKKYTVRYSAGEGGRIEGLTEQLTYYNSPSSSVDAIPYDEYEFVCWSDGYTDSHRQDWPDEDVEFTAIFKRKEYSVNYGANPGGRLIGETNQTLYWGRDASVVTAVPDEGYEFLGWSDGVTNPTRNDVGIKWNIDTRATFAPIGQTTYKVLLVFVTELHAQLTQKGEVYDADYVMSPLEREILEKIPPLISGFLNDVFKGDIKFIVDGYFTTKPVGRESMQPLGAGNGYASWGLFGERIPEVAEMSKTYRSCLTLFNMNDYGDILHDVAGSARRESGFLHTETFFAGRIHDIAALERVLDYSDPQTKIFWNLVLGCTMPELIHTFEIFTPLMDGQGLGYHEAYHAY